MICALVYGPDETGSSIPMGALTLAAVSAVAGFATPEVLALPRRGHERGFVESLGRYGLVGFTTVCSTYPRILLLCESIKAAHPDMLVVFGGPQATSTASGTIRRFGCVDLVIRGESEDGWRVLMEELESGRRDWSRIPGCTWRSAGDVIENAPAPLAGDLDLLPVPMFGAFVAGLRQMSVCMVEVGRGCPYGCTFCSTNTFFKRRFRMKTPPRILKEIDAVYKASGIREFDFVHDMFSVRRDMVVAICEAMGDGFYTWNCSCRTDRLDVPLLEMMKRSGCRGLYMGIETGSQRMQKETKKALVVTEAVAMIRYALKLGFRVTTSLIVGYPNETKQDLYDTLLLVGELTTSVEQEFGCGALIVQVHLFAPLADTPLAAPVGRFLFDGNSSNTVELDGGLTAGEAALVESSFELFSAFYHPADTSYRRNDYLALTALLETLAEMHALRRRLFLYERWQFLEFLVHGRFRVDPLTMSKKEMAQAVLADYASRGARSGPAAAFSVGDPSGQLSGLAATDRRVRA